MNAPKKIRRLSQHEFYRMCEWIKKPEALKDALTMNEVAERASAVLSIPIGSGSIREALEATGMKMPETSYGEKRKAVNGAGSDLAALANFTAQLARSLGVTVPDRITRICREEAEA